MMAVFPYLADAASTEDLRKLMGWEGEEEEGGAGAVKIKINL